LDIATSEEKNQLLFLLLLFASSGCTQHLFVDRYDGCAEIYGQAATQSIFVDSKAVGNLRATNHHSGRPLDVVSIIAQPELLDTGIHDIVIEASSGKDELSGCVEVNDGMRLCMLRNEKLSAAGVTLRFGANTNLESWQQLRDAEKFIDSISDCGSKQPNG